MIEITVPVLPESVTEGTLTTWCKQEGEHVKRDDVIAELETDKVILEIPAPHDGVLSNIIVSKVARSRPRNCWRILSRKLS